MNQYKPARLFDKKGDLSQRWYVGYYFLHPETGKYQLHQIWISLKLFTRSARRHRANEIIDSINSKLKSGFNPYQDENIGLVSINEALRKILIIKKSSTRPRTYITYKSFINCLITWLEKEKINNIPIENFNSTTAQKFADYLKIDRKLSNRSHNNYIDGLMAIFNALIERGYIQYNPFKKIRRLEEQERTIFAYNDNEMAILRNTIPKNDPQLWLVCQFIFYCAIRPAEIVKIKISHIDTVYGRLFIPPYSSKNKKGSVVDIVEPFLSDLRKLSLEKLNQDHFLFSKRLLPGSSEIKPTRLAERFRIQKEIMAISRRLYDLKHTAAGKLLDNNANARDVQLHLRHSKLETTLEYLKAFKSRPSEDFKSHYPIL